MAGSLVHAAVLIGWIGPGQLNVVTIEDRSLEWVEGAIAWRTAKTAGPAAQVASQAILQDRLSSLPSAPAGELTARAETAPGGWHIRFGLSPKDLPGWLEEVADALATPVTAEERTQARATARESLRRGRMDGHTVAHLQWRVTTGTPRGPGSGVLPGWQPGQAGLILVGAIRPAEAEALAARINWPPGEDAVVSLEPLSAARPLRSIIVDRPDLERPEVMLGWTTTSTRWGSPASRAAASILGWDVDGPLVSTYGVLNGGDLVAAARRLIGARRAVANQGLSQEQAERGRTHVVTERALARLDQVRRADLLSRRFLAGEGPTGGRLPTIGEIAEAARRLADGINPMLVVVTDADPHRLRALAALEGLEGLEVVPGKSRNPAR